jgi:hypothetical protein
MKNSKGQTPNAKELPKFNGGKTLDAGFFGFWSLEFVWVLAFGLWSFSG